MLSGKVNRALYLDDQVKHCDEIYMNRSCWECNNLELACVYAKTLEVPLEVGLNNKQVI